MPVAWFVAPYERRDQVLGVEKVRRGRYNVMDDYTQLIAADEGAWKEIEMLGQRAVVKVRASANTLQTINADPRIRGIQSNRLDDPLSTLSAAERAGLRQIALDAGYNSGEWGAAFPVLGDATLRQVLKFFVSRRRKVRYDPDTDQIVDDGPVQPTGSIDVLDGRIEGIR